MHWHPKGWDESSWRRGGISWMGIVVQEGSQEGWETERERVSLCWSWKSIPSCICRVWCLHFHIELQTHSRDNLNTAFVSLCLAAAACIWHLSSAFSWMFCKHPVCCVQGRISQNTRCSTPSWQTFQWAFLDVQEDILSLCLLHGCQ